jgi:tyrosine-protein kinase Etk/Wzc
MGTMDLLIALVARKRFIALWTGIAAVCSIVIAMLLPKIYTSTTQIVPPQSAQMSAAALISQVGGGLGGAVPGLRSPADLYIGMLRSRTVADKVIERFKLQDLFETKTLVDTRKLLEDKVRIVAGRSGIIAIEFDDKDPARAAAIANAYVEELINLTQGMALTEASQRRLFLEKQLEQTKTSLSSAEVALQQTQERTGLIKLDDQGKAIIEASARLQAQVAAKEVQLSAMRAFSTESNPDYIRAKGELGGLRAQLELLEKKTSVGSGSVLVPTGKVPELGLEYVRKLRDVKYYETIFELLARQFEIAKLDEARNTALIQVVDRAVESDRRSRPRRAVVCAVITFLGFLMAVFVALFQVGMVRAAGNSETSEKLDLLRRGLLSGWRRDS